MQTSDRKQLALDTILRKRTVGIPSWHIHIMEHEHIERLAGAQPGDYAKAPHEVYVRMQKNIGTCLSDQYLATNPLTMGHRGYENRTPGATTGAQEIVLDEMTIDSPEAVVEHLEKIVFPRIRDEISSFDEDAVVKRFLDREREIQARLEPEILKTGHGRAPFPHLRYGQYGYENYFMAYALFPEIMEKDFSLQADRAVLHNRALARAYIEGERPPMHRLDHDMADGRGTLVDIKSLDRIWFPHFARSIQPLLDANVRLIWHCDGNLMQMAPRLLEVGLSGFQGFQYEHGMDYEAICKMRTKDGDTLIINGGVSVTTTLPLGKPQDVKKQLEWLVANGPRTGLFLGASSSIVPGTPWENLTTLIEGLKYYRTHGRA